MKLINTDLPESFQILLTASKKQGRGDGLKIEWATFAELFYLSKQRASTYFLPLSGPKSEQGWAMMAS